jgi:hypothetical protein
VTLTWSQKWNPDLEHPNIRRALIVEEPIIHLKVLDQTSSQETEKEDWQISQKEELQEGFRQV